MDTDLFLDSIQWIFVTLEIISLIVFVYFISTYCRQHKSKRDSYTISCFVFILLTLISRIILKMIYLVIKHMRVSYQKDHGGVDPQWYVEYKKPINCEADISNYQPTGVFTIAILINATRWFHLIQINLAKLRSQHKLYILETESGEGFEGGQDYTPRDDGAKTSLNKHSRHEVVKVPLAETYKPRWQKIHYFILIVSVSILIVVVTFFKLFYECKQVGYDDRGFEIFEFFYLLILLSVGIYAISVFIYSARFFPKIFIEQQKIEREEKLMQRLLKLQKAKTSLTRKKHHALAHSTIAIEAQEDEQMKREIRKLKTFFVVFSIIILIKYLVHLLYDLILHFYMINNQQLKYLFVISFYSSEIAIVLLMSRSINETVNAEKQYKNVEPKCVEGTGNGGSPCQIVIGQNSSIYKNTNQASQSLMSSSEQTSLIEEYTSMIGQRMAQGERSQLIKEQTFQAIEQSNNSYRARNFLHIKPEYQIPFDTLPHMNQFQQMYSKQDNPQAQTPPRTTIANEELNNMTIVSSDQPTQKAVINKSEMQNSYSYEQ